MSSIITKGKMDWNQFVEAGDLLIKISKSLESGDWVWEWRQSVHGGNFPGSQYLVLQGDQIFGTTLLQKPEESAEFEFEEELFDEETADEFHLLDEKKKEDILFIEYHILYSEVYQCPVLYFQPHFQDGLVLTHNQVWKALALDQSNPGNTITQAEHPGTGNPFYTVHPCNTTSIMHHLMKETLNEKESKKNVVGSYFLLWLSLVSPVAKLPLPSGKAMKLLSQHLQKGEKMDDSSFEN